MDNTAIKKKLMELPHVVQVEALKAVRLKQLHREAGHNHELAAAKCRIKKKLLDPKMTNPQLDDTALLDKLVVKARSNEIVAEAAFKAQEVKVARHRDELQAAHKIATLLTEEMRLAR
jgi:ethanolamine utilization cobalamin adenosyltransferase